MEDREKKAIVLSGEARAALTRRGAEPPRDQAFYNCDNCGWSGTLKFTEEELATLDYDVRAFSGPCPGCKFMMLVEKDSAIANATGETLQQRTEREIRQEAGIYGDAIADSIVNRVKKEAGSAIGDAIREHMDKKESATDDDDSGDSEQG